MLVGQRDRARHRPDSVTNTLALERAPWRARAHRRIVDAVAGMDLVQRQHRRCLGAAGATLDKQAARLAVHNV